MANAHFSGYALPWVELTVQEPKTPYQHHQAPLAIKQATVHTQYYMHRIKANPSGSGRPVPWINLRGFWLAQAGFNIGSRYTIEVFENKLVLSAED